MCNSPVVRIFLHNQMVTLLSSTRDLIVNAKLTELGIPQDVIDVADKLGVDAKTLVQLCVQHTVEAARGWLSALASKLPKV